jgi:hypothetical protein
MLPSVASIPAGRKSGRSVTAANTSAIAAPRYWIAGAIADIGAVAAADIRVPVEVVVAIDIDVVVSSPTAATAPSAAPECAHHDAYPEGDGHTRRVVPRWRIVDRRIGIDGWTIDNHRIISRHINNLGIRLLYHNDGFVFDRLGFHFLLFIGFQIAFILSLFAHALHRIHDIALLRQESVAQVRGPLNVICQAFDDIG